MKACSKRLFTKSKATNTPTSSWSSQLLIENTPKTPNETNEELVKIIKKPVKEELEDNEKKFCEILKSHCTRIYNLCNDSNIFDPIMFADDNSLSFSHRNSSTLFLPVNNELHKIQEWFKASRLSLNIKKSKYTLFHKNSVKENTPLKLPELKIGNKAIERLNAIKFLGIILLKTLLRETIFAQSKRNLPKTLVLCFV